MSQIHIIKGAFHLATQVSFYRCYLLNAKKDRIMFGREAPVCPRLTTAAGA